MLKIARQRINTRKAAVSDCFIAYLGQVLYYCQNKRVFRLSKFAVIYEIYDNIGTFSETICNDVSILEVLRLAQDAVYKNQPYYARALQSIEDSLGIAKYENALF